MSNVTTTKIDGFPAYKLETAKHELSKAWKRACRHAAKAGQPAPMEPTLVVVATYVESRCTQCKTVTRGYAGGSCIVCRRGYLESREVITLEITGERPKLAGWEFLAVVEPLEGGNLVKQTPCAEIKDGELDAWRQGTIMCDHCQTIRRRTETFIVRADGSDPAIPAGTYKQVGRNCLEAFLGGKSPATIVAMLGYDKIVRDAGGDEDGGWGGGSEARVFDHLEFLSWTAAVIRKNGWMSRSAARDSYVPKLSTSDVVLRLMVRPFGDDTAWKEGRAEYAPTDEDKARAEAAFTWAKELHGSTDYEQNLALVARQSVLSYSHAGIMASAIPSHTKALGREIERARKAQNPSQHVGAVGDKLELELTLERVVEMSTQWGASNILCMRDDAGNLLVWKTGAAGGTPGDRIKLTGKVKKHSEFRGELQTELTRCKISERTMA